MAVNLISSNDINITQTGNDITLDVSNDIKNQKPTTRWTGTLKGGEEVILSGVKNTLIIYALGNGANMVYTMDLYYDTANRASGAEWAYDTASGLEFYLSECKYEPATNKLTHVRTGYVNVGTGTYTARNGFNVYYIYRIDTI